MSVLLELKHLLLQVLPSPAMVTQGRLLHIQNHLAMVSDSLWAINSMIIMPEIGVMRIPYLGEFHEILLDLPTEFVDWEKDVAVAIEDVRELLGRILDWEASFHHSILGNIKQEPFRCVVLEELKEMLCNLNYLLLKGSEMGLSRDPLHSMNPLREDYSNVLKKEVVGREEDVEKFIAIFQQQVVSSNNNGDHNNPFVVAIAGEPGIGKTTLAHMIYHHAWIRQQFHHHIWVDVPSSSSFKTINIIAKEFARSISNEEHRDQKLHLDLPLQVLWEFVSEQLDGSRYFLVLHCQNFDEVLREKWAQLKNILLCVGEPGSAILITSDSKIESDFTTYDLNPLSEDALMELVKSHRITLFLSPRQLKQFFEYYSGYPLFAKISGLLRYNVPNMDPFIKDFYILTLAGLRLNQYDQLLHPDVFDTDDNKKLDEVMLPMLTADYLTSDLLDLTGRFIGEIIRESRSISNYTVTKMLYLHMKIPKDSTAIPSRCRYLCLKINARARQFRLPTMSVEVSNKLMTLILQEDEETTEEDSKKITLQVYQKRRMKATIAISKFLNKMWVRLVHLRTLIVETSTIQSLPSEVSKLVNLRYLHISKNMMELLPESLFDLTNLRILSLLRCPKLQKIPERIYKLKKLEILKLAHCTKLQQLPKSITRLQNLRELNVEDCCWLSELPEDLVSFKSIEILNLTGCASLSRIPRGIERSIGLRKLLGIFVGANGGLELTQLQALTNLREMGLRHLERAEESQTEVLMGQQRLQYLSLHWGDEEVNESSESAAPVRVLEALRPNVHLKKLEILFYKGEKFPYWMSKQELAYLDSLVEVRLVNLNRCATLPSLGQLPHIEKLEISGMDLIKQIDETFYCDGTNGMFPWLRELTFSEMLVLEKLSVPSTVRALTLIQCPKLKKIDASNLDIPYLTMRIWLNNETIWSSEFFNWNNLECIEEIEIIGCQELRCLPQSMRNLRHLFKLTINGCNNLTTLIALDSLKVLEIYACPVLSFNLEAFTELWTSALKIEGCPKMQSYYIQYLEGKKNPKEMMNRSNEEEEHVNSNSNEEEEYDNSNSNEEEEECDHSNRKEEEEYDTSNSSLHQNE